ncbi:major capsid protein [Dipodfec virus UOA04_Rod_1143]|nr:major capsid protein [Dipodfec virus UOA04_Rod_1143]
MSFGFYPRPRVRLSKHYYHPERKFTCQMGKMVPCFYEEVLPGDIWKFTGKVLIRTQPLIAPIYHRVDVKYMFYYVPYRLLMNTDDWASFITGYEQSDGGSTDVVLPFVESPSGEGFKPGSLADYLGLVTGVPNFVSTSGAFPFRVYAKVINDWYINKYTTDELPLQLSQGKDTLTNRNLFSMNWEDDYFTSASITTQLGDPIYLPFGQSAPVSGNVAISGNGNALGLSTNGFLSLLPVSDWSAPALGTFGAGTTPPLAGAANSAPASQGNNRSYVGLTRDSNRTGLTGTVVNGSADLTKVASITVPELRKVSQVSLYQETMAYIGYRFTDWLFGMYGVRSSDARLQRSEFLGGTMAPLDISSVVQTSATTDTDTPQGNLSGLAVSAAKFPTWKRRFEEHGAVIGLMCILPRTGYQQGSRRMFNRTTRYDYGIPMLQHLGQQALLEKEIFAQPNGQSTQVNGVQVNNDTIFGYQWQYEDYRYMPSTSHGDFKTSLKYWTLDRIFDAPPLLNTDFVQSQPSNRVFAVSDQNYDTCLVDILYNIKAYRPLARHGVPGYLDHPMIFGKGGM